MCSIMGYSRHILGTCRRPQETLKRADFSELGFLLRGDTKLMCHKTIPTCANIKLSKKTYHGDGVLKSSLFWVEEDRVYKQ